MSESEISADPRAPTSASTSASCGDAAPAWVAVCRLDAIAPDTGVCALVGGRQLAVFRVGDDVHAPEVHAIDHRDPFTGAHVLAHGLVSHRGGAVAVASPLHKQRFCLRTGACLDDPTRAVAVWPARVRRGVVEVATTPRAPTAARARP